MRVLVDINHPAHVHQFKNTIEILGKKGHDIMVTARNKEIVFYLLDKLGIEFKEIGKYKDTISTKALEMTRIDYKLYREAKRFKPDILIGGVGNVYIAHVSALINRPSIQFNDTEHATIQNLLSFPFISTICTPSCYRKNIGKKQIRYNGYHELAYLRPNYFKPNSAILDELGLSKDETYTVLRFVAWNASHDIGCKGLSQETKQEAVKNFEKFGPVFITSESPLPKKFNKYLIRIPPEKIHNLVYYATLMYGESATMASECAVLGTHAIFSDFAGRGYTDEEEKDFGLVFNFKLSDEDQRKSIKTAVKLLSNDDLFKIGKGKRNRLLKEKIDVTAFMVWFIENYPSSFTEMSKGQIASYKF